MEKKIAVKVASSFFIAHSIEEGVHKIQRYPRNKTGFRKFKRELNLETMVGVDDTEWTQSFINDIKHLIKDYVVMSEEKLPGFTGMGDQPLAN